MGAYEDKGFGKKIAWDIPLLTGYRYKIFSKFKKYYEFYRLLKKNNFDFVLINGYAELFLVFALSCAKKLGIKTLARGESVYKFNNHNTLCRKCRALIFKKILRRLIDGFLAIGELNKDFYLKQGASPSKIYLAPYTVDNEYFRFHSGQAREKVKDTKASFDLSSSRPIILYAGKLQKRKLADQLLLAYHQMLSRLRSNEYPYLLFVGSGELDSTLHDYVQQHNLHAWVKFAGFQNQSQLPLFYEMCDIFVLPAAKENWGLVVNEVMNAAKPIIVSDEVGCGPDLVTAKNGIIFKMGDINQLSQALLTLTLDEDLRKKMGQESLQRIQQWGLCETMQGIIAACINIARSMKEVRY